MDFEFALWLMLQLCLAPKRAYLHTAYHKETKNQWARDDPAYFVVFSAFLLVSSTAFCVTFAHGAKHSIANLAYVLIVDFLCINGGIATLCWGIANKWMRKRTAAEGSAVEWLYAFDVQCNSYFVLFLLLHVVQFILTPLLLRKTFFAMLFANILYVLAFSIYHYLNFLGFSALPFLERTEMFLYPIGLLFLLLPISILIKFNPTRFTLRIYFG